MRHPGTVPDIRALAMNIWALSPVVLDRPIPRKQPDGLGTDPRWE